MSALDAEFLQSFNQFPGEFYQNTIEGVNGNVVFSPFSILIALSFAMFGASGKTATEMKTALSFNEISEEKLLESFQELTKNYENSGLAIANKIYLMKNYQIKEKFNEIATKNFQSETEIVDFAVNVEAAKNINDWVESETNYKIKDLISADSLSSDTRLVLINAIYFKADWVHPFNSARTLKRKFFVNEDDSVEIDFMSQREDFKYGDFRDLDATAVQLPYKDSKVTMLFIMPNSKTGLSALESKLNETNLIDLTNQMKFRDVELYIPKFEIEFEVDLEEPLKKMGMERMFSDAAEFDNLLTSPEPLKVSKVVHKAFIEVNEKGTEAGAATAIGFENYSMPKFFMADRGFMFALMDDSKVLFIGRKMK